MNPQPRHPNYNPNPASTPLQGGTLLQQILPTLVGIAFRPEPVSEVGQDGDLDAVPAESAKVLFNMIDAIDLEQKIRLLERFVENTQELEAAIEAGAKIRNWMLVTLLSTLYFGEFTKAEAALSLEVICSVATGQEALAKAITASPEGYKQVVEFGAAMRGKVVLTLTEHTRKAIGRGR